MMRDALKEDFQSIMTLGGGLGNRENGLGGGGHVWVGVDGLVEGLRGEGYHLGRHSAVEDSVLLVCMLDLVKRNLWASISDKVAALLSLPVIMRLRLEEFSRVSTAASIFISLAEGFLPGEISSLQKALSGAEKEYYRAYHRQNVTTLQVRGLSR